MNNINIVYWDILADKDKINEINDFCKENNINTNIYIEKHGPMNAALDELISEIFIFVNSEEVQTIKNIFDFSKIIYSIFKKIKAKFTGKPLKMVTTKKIYDKEINVGIGVDNIKILLPKDINEKTIQEYLSIAFKESIAAASSEKEIVMEFDNGAFISYFIDDYARKKIGKEYRPIKIIPLKKEKSIVNPIKVRRVTK